MNSLQQAALLIGLFGVPIALLVFGNRIRRASRRRHRFFWGAVLGHCVASLLALGASLVPPSGWTSTDTVRAVLGVWTLIALPVIGALVAMATTPRDRDR